MYEFYNIVKTITGENTLNGTIPDLLENKSGDTNPPAEGNCVSFPNPLSKMSLGRLIQSRSTNTEPFVNLKTISLREYDDIFIWVRFYCNASVTESTHFRMMYVRIDENNLSGTMPEWLSQLVNMEELSLGKQI